MNCVIRQESPADYHTVQLLIKDAFQSVPQSNQTEHDIVARLRNSPAFVNGLSLVAELDGVVIAHILLSKVLIKNEDSEFECLSLAPVSVTPKFQKQGVGSQLIKHAHRVAKDLGYTAVVSSDMPAIIRDLAMCSLSSITLHFPLIRPLSIVWSWNWYQMLY